MKKNKNILNPDVDKGLDDTKQALIFSYDEEIRKIFTRFVYECFEFSAYAIQDKDLLKPELWHHIK